MLQSRLCLIAVAAIWAAVSPNAGSEIGETKGTVLAFGGNGFIGSEVVARFIKRNYRVVLVSRGNWYFDSAERIKPHVEAVYCDREEGIDSCHELLKIINKIPRFDIVLDFSGYLPHEVKEAVELLRTKADLYVYISTDSIYEVCVEPVEWRPNREEDAIRPAGAEEQERLKELDSYADEKLSGEEMLLNHRGNMSYLIFRLPDVFGPRDTTVRWWLYQMWMEFYDYIQVPIFIPPDTHGQRTSLIYVKDVAKAVLLAVDKGPEVWNTVYNLGFDRDFTLEELLHDISASVNPLVEFDYEDSENAFYSYPTVKRALNITKAKKVLGFKPMNWEQALKETVEFNAKALHTYEKEREEVLSELVDEVLPPERQDQFWDMVDNVLAEGDLTGAKDEL